MKPKAEKKKEKSRYAAQVVVYELREGSWVPARALGPRDDEEEDPEGPAADEDRDEERHRRDEQDPGEEETWSEMHLFARKAAQNKAFRVVAWNGREEVVLNAKLRAKMTFALTGPDFGELRGGDTVYGFYFAAAEQAEETAAAVRGALDELAHPRAESSPATFAVLQQEDGGSSYGGSSSSSDRKTKNAAAHTPPLPSEAFQEQQALDREENNNADDDEDPPPSSSSSSEHNQLVVEPITGVSDFRHDTHVVFNAEKSRYEGLPHGWTHVNKQFGVELAAVPQTGQVPTVLRMLEDTLRRLGGLDVTGIFRVAPDGEDCRDAREAIDAGQGWDSFEDVHVVATLIKQFFRDLPPVGLLNRLAPDHIAHVAHVATHPDDGLDRDALVAKALDALDAPNRALLDWLFDLMADVVARHHLNKMTSKNMAIVMSPNLFSIAPDAEPMAAITVAQQVADCTNAILDARLRQRHAS